VERRAESPESPRSSGSPGAPSPGPPALDNPVWWALTTRQSPLAERIGRACRYRPDVALFAAVDSFDPESWADLAELLGPDGRGLLVLDAVPVLPDGWTMPRHLAGFQLAWTAADLPGAKPVEVRPLGDDDVTAMLALVALTEPGPFLPRTIEMGDYLGVFAHDELVAMAGERLRPDGLTEISAVCTHPRVRGQGLASGLVREVMAGVMARGEQPFLHVAAGNVDALRLYEDLGFVRRRSVEFVVLRPPAP
jgi:ribosomal protein S18 acetylase RimI-like enzyme